MKRYLIVRSHKEPSSQRIQKAGRVITADDWLFRDGILHTEEIEYNLYLKKFCITSGDKLIHIQGKEYEVVSIGETDVEMNCCGQKYVYQIELLISLFKSGLFQKS